LACDDSLEESAARMR